MQEMRVQCLGQEDLLELEMANSSSMLAWKIPGKSLGQRSLAGYSAWFSKESDMIVSVFACTCVQTCTRAHTHTRAV